MIRTMLTDAVLAGARGHSRRHRTLLGRALALLALGRSRRQLGRLDSHRLRDLGLSPEEARREAQAPVWNAPDHWLR